MITVETLNNLEQHSFAEKNIGGSILAKIANYNRLLHPVLEYSGKEHPAFEQGKTGYCWMSALLFCLYQYGKMNRPEGGKLLSKSYLAFYDKLEKANQFLESVMDLLGDQRDIRALNYLLENAMSDRGQWEMGANLIRKYGVIPYEAMPDTSANTSNVELNACLSLILRCTAVKLQKIYRIHQDTEMLQSEKRKCLQTVYQILIDYFGCPPKNVGTLTPIQYFEQQIDFPFDRYISISCAGQPPFVQYEVALDGNIIEGHRNSFLSVPNAYFEKAMLQQVEEESFCWFTCDTGKFYLKNLNLLDDSMLDFDRIMIGTDYTSLIREELYQFHIATMTHAMVLCERLEGSYWIAKNSQATERSELGSYCAISESWFRKYIFQGVVNRKFLPSRLVSAAATRTVMPWEFFGGEM